MTFSKPHSQQVSQHVQILAPNIYSNVQVTVSFCTVGAPVTVKVSIYVSDIHEISDMNMVSVSLSAWDGRQDLRQRLVISQFQLF